MARPIKGAEKNRPNHVGFRVSDAVRDALAAEAERRDVSMADVANAALEQYLKITGENTSHATK